MTTPGTPQIAESQSITPPRPSPVVTLPVEAPNHGAGLASPGLAKLSILMPTYNEERTLAQAITSVLTTTYPCESELIVVDDGSSDGTAAILKQFTHDRLVVIHHTQNRGKGAALRSGSMVATGTHLVPFDADLEYDPADLIRMIDALLMGRGDVIYGTRIFGANTRYQSYHHALGNRALTLAASVLFDAYLSDMHTCLKLVPVDLFRDLRLTESGFGLDTEMTAKMLKMGIRPFEVPVSYCSRSVSQGKKISWRDGVACLKILGRVRWDDAWRGVRVGDLPARETSLPIRIGHSLSAEPELTPAADRAAA